MLHKIRVILLEELRISFFPVPFIPSFSIPSHLYRSGSGSFKVFHETLHNLIRDRVLCRLYMDRKTVNEHMMIVQTASLNYYIKQDIIAETPERNEALWKIKSQLLNRRVNLHQINARQILFPFKGENALFFTLKKKCLQYVSGLSFCVWYVSIQFNMLPHLQTCWFYFSSFDLAMRYWQEENHFSYLPNFSWEIDPFKKATCCDCDAPSTYCNLRHASCVLKLTFLKLTVWG